MLHTGNIFFKRGKSEVSPLYQGFPTTDWTSTSLWPLGNWVTQQEVSSKLMKPHLHLRPLPIAGITAWAPPLVRLVAASDSRRSTNPTVCCACEGYRLGAPSDNLVPDALRWNQVVMLALGSGCTYRRSLAERFDFTETVINQLFAHSYQNPISEW